MASVIVCDKCRAYSNDVTKFMNIRAFKFSGMESIEKHAENHMDLCQKCYEKLFKEVFENGN